MKRNQAVFCSAIAGMLAGFHAAGAEPKPNILVIMVDQQQASAMSGLGHPTARTPHLDRLAKRGVLFTRAYCPSPACGPSRAAMFTGYFPTAIGVVKNHDPVVGPVEFLPEVLKRAGY